MIDTEMLRMILWIAAGLLMLFGAGGVVLAVLLDRTPPEPMEHARPARIAEARVKAPAVPAEPVDEKTLAARKAAYGKGIYVFVALAVLTGLEFVVASLLPGSTALLFLVAMIKAGVIVQYYMHLNQVWSAEEAHE
jgi:uncharacterized membrane protein